MAAEAPQQPIFPNFSRMTQKEIANHLKNLNNQYALHNPTTNEPPGEPAPLVRAHAATNMGPYGGPPNPPALQGGRRRGKKTQRRGKKSRRHHLKKSRRQK